MSIKFDDTFYELANKFGKNVEEIEVPSQGMDKIGSIEMIPNMLMKGENGLEYKIENFVEFKIEPTFIFKHKMPCDLHKTFNDDTGPKINCPVQVPMAYFECLRSINNSKAFTDKAGNIYFEIS
jgi:hypothetical protein